MQFRSSVVFMFTSLAALCVSGTAAADPGGSRSSIAGTGSHLALERDLERAMAQMDRNLSVLLGSRTMDCAGDDAVGVIETCWVSLESVQAADAPHGVAHH